MKRGYVVYMGDLSKLWRLDARAAMDEPASKNQPVTRSYLALRDVEAMVITSSAPATCRRSH